MGHQPCRPGVSMCQAAPGCQFAGECFCGVVSGATTPPTGQCTHELAKHSVTGAKSCLAHRLSSIVVMTAVALALICTDLVLQAPNISGCRLDEVQSDVCTYLEE